MWIFYRIKDFIKNLPRNIKWFFQRGIRGYADCDVWDIDYWFLNTIIPMLKQFNKTKHGYPGNITAEEWDKIIDKMIFYFTESDEQKCSKQNQYKDQFNNIIWQDGILYFDKNKLTKTEYKQYNNIRHKYFQREKELSQYREKKKNQAFKLFSEYFWHLWD